ncbi:MAG: hypothetical protein ACLFVJ_23570, partial [Persicimonas sp.]
PYLRGQTTIWVRFSGAVGFARVFISRDVGSLAPFVRLRGDHDSSASSIDWTTPTDQTVYLVVDNESHPLVEEGSWALDVRVD